MYQKLLATLPAILATTAFAQPIYFTANDLRTASPAATVGNAVDYPAHLNQPIYFIANKLRTGAAQAGKESRTGARVADATAALASGKRVPAN